MKKLILLIVPFFLYAESLKSLLEYATQNNQLVESKAFSQQSKQKEVDSKKSNFYPTIDVGAYYQSVDERNFMVPGDVYSGYAKVGFDIYDGGGKPALLKQKRDEFSASTHDLNEIKKSISLQIINNFFNIKSLESSLSSREEAQRSLKVQLDRMSAFYDAHLATKDDVDRLQAAFDTNIYDMESNKLQILSLKLNLQLQVGKEIGNLDESSFNEQSADEIELIDSIKSLKSTKESIKSFANSIDSIYYPQLRVEDTYNFYGYGNVDAQHPEGVDAQNKIMLTANFRLYDNATIGNSKQAVEISSQALSKRIEYKTAEQKMQHDLAVARINTSKIKIKSASSALTSAASAFNTIEKKYTAGIVDNVTYLDALVSKTKATSLHKTSLNDLQVAYGIYYYYAGKNMKEFLNE